ncbi:MAG: chromosome segregation protein SMC [Saprospiraceae bacterium]
MLFLQAMRLKTLEIKGFKSFANETVINFSEDVIGIVGPNGSGKSNIVDAIRWVLGEQKSKELRLDKMSSVIFNGTKKKKKGNTAQVTLTFENTKNLLPTEYHTVSISRILYRSGDSEYRLNNVPCRLKDITTLFLDTGIGSNSYAIIALGMVDDLLNDKDNSRRKMFEQAAGISKYKRRKHETLNKLKNTTEDLDRVEDLLFEIEGNLKSLEKQAKRAKKYYELKNDYKSFSVELSKFKLSAFSGKNKDFSEKIQSEEDKIREMDVQLRTMEATLESEKKTNLDSEKLLSESQRELNELVNSVREMENQKNIAAQKVGFINQNKAKLTEQITSADSKVVELQKAIDINRSDLNLDKQLEEQLEDELENAKQRLDQIKTNHGDLKTELDEFLQSQQVVEREIFELEKNKAINSNQIENLTAEITRSAGDVEGRQSEIGSLESKLTEIRESESFKMTMLKALEEEETQRQKDIEGAEKELEDLTKHMTNVNRSLDSKRNEFKLTKSMVDNLEGFPESIKFLKNHKDWAKNATLLSDLIYVNEDVRVAIENYLTPYLNYYVVQKMDDAFDAIKLLGNSQKGKANFFVLDAFQNYVPPMSMVPGTQRAIDLVQTDKEYFNMFSHLLENVVVSDSDNLQPELINKNVTILSRSGRVVQRKYSISGGSVGLFEGKKIGRKKNLEVLELEIKKLEKEENKFSTVFYNLKTKIENLKGARKDQKISTEKDALSQIAQNKVSLMTRLENFESFITEVNDKTAQAHKLIESLVAANDRFEQSLLDKRAEADNAKKQISEKDDGYRVLADQLSSASQAYNEKNIEFIRQQNKVTTIQRDLKFKESTLEETKFRLTRNQKVLEENSEELDFLKEDIEKFEKELLVNYGIKEEKEKNLSNAEQIYFKARGGINEIDDELRNLNRKKQNSITLLSSLKEKYSELKLNMASIGERLKIEFNILIDDIINEAPDENLNPKELEEKVAKLKKRLDNYGEINPMAVEAYDEMKVRYDTISDQRNDILEAKKSLLETIKEIENKATSQFMEAFEKVRVYFKEAFRTLFSEDDDCDITLEDEENPLDSKIRILAKPKGKRPQSISQLSGGEKTLTATALLFSLYLLKPAPFCIFDEVDAPLDDANIEKFNKIIRRFSVDSQFIIVTHNKMTMAAVDVIYGVYMAEPGISGVSEVDFRDLEETSQLEEIIQN